MSELTHLRTHGLTNRPLENPQVVYGLMRGYGLKLVSHYQGKLEGREQFERFLNYLPSQPDLGWRWAVAPAAFEALRAFGLVEIDTLNPHYHETVYRALPWPQQAPPLRWVG